MTTTVTEVWRLVPRFAGLCEVHRFDLDSLISILDANYYRILSLSGGSSVTQDWRRACADAGSP